ncbi:MAG: TIGR03621 family F420-dependent LLM class oxidoreductase [Chloroflexaceae bacterium]|jgi:probable F420-dependent oxidoreductase|nr:TIGR03621 family F420-dependent LLM class oxidoreductase [Chloroflexaceae bacterium]
MNTPRPFRFGVINEQLLPAAAWRQQLQAIEAWGYDTFLIRDHVVPDYFGDQYGPIAAMMAAASLTRRLRVGTMVFDNDYRHPAFLAKECATIDALSDGRFELGIGAGWLRREYDLAGLPFDAAGTRIGRLEEALHILKTLWAGEACHFTGQHYQISGLTCVPLPVQRPHPPILIGGGQRRMLTLAGREATSVGVLTTSVASGSLSDDYRERLPEAVVEKLNWVREGAGERFAEIELSLIPTVIITDERRHATEQLITQRGWAELSAETVWGMPSVFIGNLAHIAEEMQQRREQYGFSYYIFSDEQAKQLAPLVAQLANT